MAINNLRIPIAPVLHVFKKPDSELMKRIQYRVIVVVPVLVDDQAARLQPPPEFIDIGLRRSPDKRHHNQVPLFGSKVELVVPSHDSVERYAELPRVFLSDSHCLIRWIESRHLPSLGGQENRVPPLSHAEIERLPRRNAINGSHQQSARPRDENRRILRGVEFIPQDASPFRIAVSPLPKLGHLPIRLLLAQSLLDELLSIRRHQVRRTRSRRARRKPFEEMLEQLLVRGRRLPEKTRQKQHNQRDISHEAILLLPQRFHRVHLHRPSRRPGHFATRPPQTTLPQPPPYRAPRPIPIPSSGRSRDSVRPPRALHRSPDISAARRRSTLLERAAHRHSEQSQ